MEHLPRIVYKTISHSEQRYNTLGDYFLQFDGWNFRSSGSTAECEAAIFIHEFVEWFLTQKKGITEESITAFDIKHIKHPDPGMLKNAPYHRQHLIAMKFEKMFLKEVGMTWKKYCNILDKLEYKKVK
jgi:hypothetical protein